MRVREVVSPQGQISYAVVEAGESVVEPIDRFLAYLSRTESSPNTIRSYAYDLKTYWTFLNGRGLCWRSPDSDTIAAFLENLRWPARADKAVDLRPTPARSATTVNRALAAVGSFYDFHVRCGLDIGNALEVIRGSRAARRHKGFLAHLDSSRTRSTTIRLKPITPGVRTLTATQVSQLLDACGRLRDRLLIACLFDGGLRIGEALGLRHEDISPARCEIMVTARDSNLNGARAKSGSRVVPVSAQLICLYNDYLDEELGSLDTDYVFVRLWRAPLGEPLRYEGAYDLVRRLRRRTGIHFTFHQLRHTYATDLLRAGVTPEVVKELLGHASVQTTSQTYSHLDVEDLHAALRRAAAKRVVVLR